MLTDLAFDLSAVPKVSRSLWSSVVGLGLQHRKKSFVAFKRGCLLAAKEVADNSAHGDFAEDTSCVVDPILIWARTA